LVEAVFGADPEDAELIFGNGPDVVVAKAVYVTFPVRILQELVLVVIVAVESRVAGPDP